ncbi:hypothetical protein EIP91_002685 [Steccherinum ochraceum]|uniref:Mid2 domain-containing protein n=1 Tax=Steccherinum ochraceum TaxID=92696 RepID=A0A4R0RK81_9APHY|nr:hypothetical protein EIP91_002685 [Steccherinum ochraceum]
MKKRFRIHSPHAFSILLLLVHSVWTHPIITTHYAGPTFSALQDQPLPTARPDLQVNYVANNHAPRALNEIFNTLNGGEPTLDAGKGEHRSEATHAPDGNELASLNTLRPTMTGPGGLFGHTTSSASTTSGTTSAHSQSTATTTTQGKYSVIGTLPPVPSATGGNTIMTSWANTAASANPTASAAPVESPGSSKDQAIKQWKIIGVAVIAFSTVAAILLLAVFFDQWWRFVKDVFGRGRRKLGKGEEELVPDWEKASWEVRFGDDRHRYPSFTSIPSDSGAKGKGGAEGGWVRSQPSPSPLGRGGSTQETRDASSQHEVDISTMSPHHDAVQSQMQQYAPHSPRAIWAPPSPRLARQPSQTSGIMRSKSQRSQRSVNPFDDPPLPRSPRSRSISVKSISGESVYGGIA